TRYSGMSRPSQGATIWTSGICPDKCRDDGTGRRGSLKRICPLGRAGSSPAPGTTTSAPADDPLAGRALPAASAIQALTSHCNITETVGGQVEHAGMHDPTTRKLARTEEHTSELQSRVYIVCN